MKPTALPDGYDYHVVSSAAQYPGLTCRFLKPADFRLAELPAETPDFSKTTVFLPLAVAAAQYGPLVFSIAARPAFEDGSVTEWLDYLLRQEGYAHEPIAETCLGNLPAVTCDVLQKGEESTMRMRFVLLEDGGRLFQITAMAPDPIWPGVQQKFAPMLQSFELREVQGTKVPLYAGGPVPVIPPPPAPAPATRPLAPADGGGRARLTDAELLALALANDAATLDPEHPTNVRLRNRGVGLVPRLLSVDLFTKSAWIAAGAAEGSFRVPLGWHVIDDGQRTLIFDADGRIQVNLNQRRHEGLSTRDFARGCLQQYLNQQPALDTACLEWDGIAGAGVRGARIEGEILDQYFLVRDLGRPQRYLVTRVTANADDATRALNLAGDILATFETP